MSDSSFFPAVFLTLGALLCLPGPTQGQVAAAGDLMEVEVATVGVDLNTGATLALLHSDWEAVLPIWIGEVEAGAIADALRGQRPPRPMTHDLLTSVLGELGGTLEEIVVHDLRENIYYGTLRIRTSAGLLEVDSRPSDALALAVRTGARVLAERSLIEGAPDAEFLSVQGERSIVRLRGMTVSTILSRDRERFSLPSDVQGLVVLHADQAVGPRGVRRGDVVLEVQGQEIGAPSAFLDAVVGTSPSSSLEIRVLREGEERRVEVPPRRAPGRVGP
jgi:uncharacterized protein